MVTSLDDYEKALVVLGLRQLSAKSYTEAIAQLKAGHSADGAKSTQRGEAASALADRIQAES